jgi:hypothetical protein
MEDLTTEDEAPVLDLEGGAETVMKRLNGPDFQFVKNRNERRRGLKKCNARQAAKDVDRLIMWIGDLVDLNFQLSMAAGSMLAQLEVVAEAAAGETVTEGGIVLPMTPKAPSAPLIIPG